MRNRTTARTLNQEAVLAATTSGVPGAACGGRPRSRERGPAGRGGCGGAGGGGGERRGGGGRRQARARDSGPGSQR